MARKVYYSQPLKYFWKHLYGTQKKFTPDLTDEQIFYLLKKSLLDTALGVGETQELRGLTITGLELWRKDSKGELLHIFFLDKELRDFLEETSLSDLDGIKTFLYQNGKSNDVFHTYSNIQTEHIFYRYTLHLPYEADGYAFSLSIAEDGAVELYFSQGENAGRMSDKYYTELNKKNDQTSLTILKMFRLAINTIAYMNCFPDCVTDGVPNNLFEKSVIKADRNVTIELSEKIKEIGNSPTSKIPHFRKGHFRFLRSDYFAKKKGQMVFVGETMVKGKAKTVSMSPETDGFVANSFEINS